MTNAAQSREYSPYIFRYLTLTLAAGQVGYLGADAYFNPATGKVVRGLTGTGYIPIGVFAKDVDASSADKRCEIDLCRTVECYPYENAPSTDAVVAADLGAIVYGYDDQTVTRTSTGRTPVGRMWKLDGGYVWVERVREIVAVPQIGSVPLAAAFTFTANDFAPTAAQLVSGVGQVVGTTAAPATVTLPDDSPSGTVVPFFANGTANGHTVTYRQNNAGSPVALTTALTASRRHTVIAYKFGAIWAVNAYVNAS